MSDKRAHRAWQPVEKGDSPSPHYRFASEKTLVRKGQSPFSTACWGLRSLLCVLIAVILAGCAATFSPSGAREVSRDRLLQISEMGKSDHLTYMGSDFNYHYVFDSRPGK
ncbi:MAG TPA: hypothetical protein VGH74_03075, partial [Planctomycetaceae bacterium]